MRAMIAACVVAACGLTGSAGAASDGMRPAQCKLVVEGRTYIKGRCNFQSLGTDGSFAIGVLRDDQPVPKKGFYFAYVDVHGNTAEAKWNDDPMDQHADAPLGTLTRKGACWESATAQICAW